MVLLLSLVRRDATELVSQLESELSVELPATLMFDFSTAGALVEAIASSSRQPAPRDECKCSTPLVAAGSHPSDLAITPRSMTSTGTKAKS